MNQILIPAGVLLSALAQVALKSAARFPVRSLSWYAAIAGAGLSYLVSFGVYSLILRKSELSRTSPLMASAVALLAAAAGMILFGETLTWRKGLGIVLGIAAISLLAW